MNAATAPHRPYDADPTPFLGMLAMAIGVFFSAPALLVGIALARIARRMGHCDYKTTLIYADYAPIAHEREARRAGIRWRCGVASARGDDDDRDAAMMEIGDNRDDARAVLFTAAPVSDDELMARQRITAPRGLESLADPDWDDERDDPYLRALLGE